MQHNSTYSVWMSLSTLLSLSLSLLILSPLSVPLPPSPHLLCLTFSLSHSPHPPFPFPLLTPSLSPFLFPSSGIVSNASPLVQSPEIITYIKNRGLLLCTYGIENNQRHNVQLQKDYGVDSVIVDHVEYIASYLEGKAVRDEH